MLGNFFSLDLRSIKVCLEASEYECERRVEVAAAMVRVKTEKVV